MNKALEVLAKLTAKPNGEVTVICEEVITEILGFCSQQLRALNKDWNIVLDRYNKTDLHIVKGEVAAEMDCIRKQLAIINNILDIIESKVDDA